MSDVAVRAVGLGKQYRIGERQKYKAIRDALTDAMSLPFRIGSSFFTGRSSETKESAELWALKNVSFEINQGEVVGVIGRNGAGKSTLLKILSRITEPTEGYVDLHGRVGTLLEVGTGFHPELTGRENIYLNGSIIGMTKREINCKFDEIVTFAEIEQFLDTPVKFYSTGMHMRLAFAVAAHLEPEILLVDEVLAVGDGAFQKKCLGKMSRVANEGRTVLFVSHSMAAVQSLCRRCILFEKGEIVLVGSADECMGRYLAEPLQNGQRHAVVFPKPSGGTLRMDSATVLCNGAPSSAVFMGDSLSLSVDFVSEKPIRNPRLAFIITTQNGIRLINSSNRYQGSSDYASPVNAGTIRCDLGIAPLAEGGYSISLYFGNPIEDTHVAEDAMSFEVIGRDIWGEGQASRANVSCLWWPTTFHFLAQ
jgi:lipopolysaccharide transport system ATP-binding protein